MEKKHLEFQITFFFDCAFQHELTVNIPLYQQVRSAQVSSRWYALKLNKYAHKDSKNAARSLTKAIGSRSQALRIMRDRKSDIEIHEKPSDFGNISHMCDMGISEVLDEDVGFVPFSTEHASGAHCV